MSQVTINLYVTGLDIIPQYVVLDSDYLFLSLFLLLLFWVFARL